MKAVDPGILLVHSVVRLEGVRLRLSLLTADPQLYARVWWAFSLSQVSVLVPEEVHTEKTFRLPPNAPRKPIPKTIPSHDMFT